MSAPHPAKTRINPALLERARAAYAVAELTAAVTPESIRVSGSTDDGHAERPADALSHLTTEELEVRAELLGTEPTDEEVARAERVAGTTTATLIALAAFLASVDDDAGADLMRRFATEYATHEATVI